MELVLNEEQKLLRDSAETFTARHAGPSAHRALRETATGFDGGRLAAAAEAGWLALTVPEAKGGLGLGLTEQALILEAAGRGLMTEPLGALAAVARALAVGRASRGMGAVLDQVVAGTRIILPALRDPAAAAGDGQEITAFGEHHGYQLNGRRVGVPLAGAADAFLVDALVPDGTILCLVPREAAGVTVELTDTVDGGADGTITFSGVTVIADKLVAGARDGARLAGEITDHLLIGAAAEMLGVMEQALELATEYMRTREQFGRPIGSFQALQHMAVDAHVAQELTRSLLYQVCAALDAGRGNRAMAAALKARASAAVLAVTKSVIQMHGAIGFTDEYAAGLYLRRAMVLAARHGNAGHHRARYAALVEAEAAAAPPAKARRKRKRKRSPSAFAEG